MYLAFIIETINHPDFAAFTSSGGSLPIETWSRFIDGSWLGVSRNPVARLTSRRGSRCLGQEFLDTLRRLFRPRHHEQMPIINDLEPGIGDEAC